MSHLIGTMLGYEYNSAHWNHIHVEPPTKKYGTPPLSVSGMTPGTQAIYDALEAEFGKGAYFNDVAHHWEPNKFVIDEPGIGWVHMGYYNRRKIAGSTSWSQHSWANALDIGPYYGAQQDKFADFLRGHVPNPDPVEGEESMLKQGDKGNAVTWFQLALNGYQDTYGDAANKIAVDGVYGSATTGAVKAYQRSAGLPQTGTIDGVTSVLLARFHPTQGVLNVGKGSDAPSGYSKAEVDKLLEGKAAAVHRHKVTLS